MRKMISRCKSRLSLSADGWSDARVTGNYLGIMCHFFSGDGIKNLFLAIEIVHGRSTATNLRALLNATIDRYNIPFEKIISIVTDNAKNMGAIYPEKFIGSVCTLNFFFLVVFF